MPTVATGTAGIPRVNQSDRNTSPGSLIVDKRAELVESPGMPLVSVCTSNRCSLTNACQVFQSDCLACTSSFVYQGLCYAVVRVFLKTLLASAHCLETTFRRACTYLLQYLTAFVIVFTNSLNLNTTKRLTLTVSSKVHDAQINA